MYQHRVARRRPQPKKVVKKSLKVRTILVAGLVVFALIVFVFLYHDTKNKQTVQSFQQLEPHGRQILMGVQIYFVDHLRFPAGQEEFDRIVSEFDPEWSAEDQLLLAYEALEEGKKFTFSITRKDSPEFMYVCTDSDGCRWDPRSPYP